MLREGARAPVFWVLFATFFICGCSTNGLIQTHFITLCGDYGLAAVAAASVLAMMGVFDFVGTIGSGWLSDRFDSRWLLFWYYGLRGLSLLYLPFTSFTFYGLSLFAVFYGLDWIATVPPTVKLTADRFGRERAGILFGWIFAGHQIGAATAAFGAGFSRTEFSSYLPAFFVAGALCMLASALVLTIARPKAIACLARRAPCARIEKLDYFRFASILSQISAATSGPPRFLMARMPVGEVTLISVRKSPITSMPTNSSPRSRKAGPRRSQMSRSRSVRSVAFGAPPRTMLERRSSAAGTRLTAPANSPSTRMMRLSPSFTAGRKFCTTHGSRNMVANRS